MNPKDTAQQEDMAIRRRVPRLRRLLLGVLIALGAIAMGFAWIVASPPGGGPDDDLHQTSIWCPKPGANGCQIVGYTDTLGDAHHPIVEVPARIPQVKCFAFQSEQSAACLNDVPADAMAESSQVNTTRYPGEYYMVMHVFASSSPSELGAMDLMVRSANALIAALFFGMLAWLLPWSMRRLLTYVMVGFSVPLVIYMLTSINPSAWAIIGVISAWFALTGLFATKTIPVAPWRRRVLAGVAVAAVCLAAMARTDAATYCFVAVLAVGAAHFQELRPSRWRANRLIWVTMVVVSVIGIVGTFGGSQTSGIVGLSGSNPGGFGLLVTNVAQLPDLIAGFWTGNLGWFDVPLKPVTTLVSLAVGVGLLFGGLRRMHWTKGLAAGGVAVILAALPIFTLQMTGSVVGSSFQPRYLAPLMLMLAAIMISRARRDGAAAWSVTQTWVVYASLTLAHAVALRDIIRRYVVGTDGPQLNLNGVIEWWRAGLPSPLAVWAIGSVGFACLALLLFVVRRNGNGIGITDLNGSRDE